jgi:glycerol-3-phosphate dehydrogenase
LNIGEEMREEMQSLGFKLKNSPWFGEDRKSGASDLLTSLVTKIPNAEIRERVAAGMWRRHGLAAMGIVANWTGADVAEVFEGLGFTAGELRHIAQSEHVLSAQDLLRRRTPIALVRTQSEIDNNQTLQGILTEFGLA